MTLSDLTTQIVRSRDSKKTDFQKMNTQLIDMKGTLEHIESLSDDVIWSSIIEDNKCSDLWKEIYNSASNLIAKVRPFIARGGDFSIAKDRAYRKFVNVGAIGITREGKSEYIARITELGDWLLPRRTANQPCTTAPINIINGKSKDSKENFVRIYFFTIPEILEQLRTFVEELGGSRAIIPNTIQTRKELKKWLNDNKDRVDQHLAANLKDFNVTKKVAFIEGFFANYEQYVDLLVEDPTTEKTFRDLEIDKINEGKNEGELYYSSVSYYKRPNAPAKDKIYNSYATKLAEIYTQFDVAGEVVSNIQFLDTPGIGEQKVGLERALSDAVAMNLDVILVVKSVRKEITSQDANRNTLITLLRNRLNGKDHAPESVYFLLNMWEDVGYDEGADEIQNLKTTLETNYNVSPIILNDSQFRMINVVGNYEVQEDKIIRENPLGRYLRQILNSLIPKIQHIDADYFRNAETYYAELSNDFSELKANMRKLANKLPSIDISERVDKLLKDLHDKLDLAMSEDNAIDGGIVYSIQEFCEQNSGIVLGTLLGNPNGGLSNIDNYAEIDKFCSEHKDGLANYYRISRYKGFMDFQQYENLKLKLCQMIENEIYSRIDTEQADKDLAEIKKRLAEVFITVGKLSFISDNPEEWWVKMAQKLSDENAAESLVTLFEELGNFSIDYRSALKEKMTEIMRACKHCDNFGDPTSFNFQEYNTALRSIVHSLLHIEQTIQDTTEEVVVRRTIDSLMSTFDDAQTKLIRAVSLPEADEPTIERKAMYRFYKKHAKEIFNDDNEAQMQALISSWNTIIN